VAALEAERIGPHVGTEQYGICSVNPGNTARPPAALTTVAAAVIGGTSLFGGRDKAIHAVLGGIVIATIDNGMGLQGFSAASRNVVTAIVLIAAVTVDAVARRSATTR
jgi:ABC-type xylose transport system permease subunit